MNEVQHRKIYFTAVQKSPSSHTVIRRVRVLADCSYARISEMFFIGTSNKVAFPVLWLKEHDMDFHICVIILDCVDYCKDSYSI